MAFFRNAKSVEQGEALETSPSPLSMWLSKLANVSSNTKRSTAETSGSEGTTPRKRPFIYSHHFERWPEGWPRLAAQQNHYQNRPIHRRYGYLLQRVIHHHESCLVLYEERLSEIDWDDARNKHPRLRGRPRGKLRKPDAFKPEEPDEYEELMDLISSTLQTYHGLMMAARDFESLPRVSYKEHRDAWDKLQEDQYLDKAAMRFMTHASDFVTTRLDRSHTPFERLIYDWPNSPMAALFRYRGRDDRDVTYRADYFKICFKFALVTYCSLLILVPAGILYLEPLSKEASLGVVVAFVIIFTLSITFVTGLQTGNVAACAYAAVLITVLAQLGTCNFI